MRPRTTTLPDSAPGHDCHPALSLAACILALWAVHALLLDKLTFTGDEVRYAAYGLGLFHGQGFHPSDDLWRAMVADSGLTTPLATSPAGHAGRLIHSVVYPLLGAPALYLGGLDAARWLSFGVGCLGLLLLYRALRLRFAHPVCLTTLVAVAFACPLLFYLRLFFAEILLFTCNALVVLFFLSRRHEDPANAVWAALGLCLLPFVHVKLSLEAAVAFAIVFGGGRTRLSRRGKLAMLAIAGTMFVLFLLYNYAFFGIAVGGGNPAFPVTLRAIPDRILTNLLDMRHGLLPNAPHLLLALVGLFFVWRDREPTGRILLALLAAYFLTMLWANGSEAYAARNWTAAMPFVAFGLARWLAEPGRADKWLALPFFLLGFCLLCVAVQFPDAFLDSRNFSVPYERLFDMLPWFQFGYLLPYDFLDHEGAGLYAAWGRGLGTAAVLGLFTAGQILAVRGPRDCPRGVALQILALGVIVFFSLVTRIEDTATVITRLGHNAYVACALARPTPVAFVRLVNPRAAMQPYGFFNVALCDGRNTTTLRTRASAVVPLPPFTPAQAVLLAESPDHCGRRWLDTATGVALYRRVLTLPGLDD